MTNNINLKKQQIFWFEPEKTQSLKLVAGTVWITISGCQKDFIVTAGQPLPKSDQNVLIQALTDDVSFYYDFVK